MNSAANGSIPTHFVNLEMNPNEVFPFRLDDFQLEAIDALNHGYSVVVSAPTGSGKTLVGEYAIYRAISHGQKVFYTTPLKALSNQKLRDFRDQFGIENVGLMTGDLTVNRDAAVLVMTTEIFRNMLYAEADRHNDLLKQVEAVVLDECHYMNDSQRGTVWEESIIYCPSSIQLVALSATVANAGQLTDWIQRVHGPTELVFSDFRPVPLHFKFCSAKGLHPLLNKDGTGLDPNCKVWRAPKGNKKRGRGTPKIPQPEPPPIGLVVSKMAESNMLPAIYFIFSRKGCDRAVKEFSKKCFLTKEQQLKVRERLKHFSQDHPEAVRDSLHADALLRGVVAHHAGVLPAWKALIEELFQQGLIKVVFATETLAAGINMPAKSTVISSMSKRTESGHRPLTNSEFLQMAGRAGRRGLDSEGYVVVVQNRFEGVAEAGRLATSNADPLASQFTPSYGMVINLLQKYDLKKAKELVNRSFGKYLASLDLVEEEEILEELNSQLIKFKNQSIDIPWDDFEIYEKKRSRLREERRLLRILKQQAAETLSNELTLALKFASLGTLVSLKSPQLKSRISPAVIVDKLDGFGQFPLLLCLTDENIWLVQTCQAVVSLHAELACLSLSDIEKPALRKVGEICHGDDQSQAIALEVQEVAKKYDMRTPQYDLAGEVLVQVRLVNDLEGELENQPAHKWRDRKKLKKHRRRMEELEVEIQERKNSIHHKANRHWESFISLLEILQHFGCLDEHLPNEIGRTVGALRGDNQLWLGLALISGHLDELKPPHLAAVCFAISTEVNRPDLWSGFLVPNEADEALNNLSGIRRELFLIQGKFQMTVPIWLEPDLMGVVDAWARGISWVDLISNTSLDEGDVVRIMRRTMDLLSQVSYCEAISKSLKSNAKIALKLINRFPVCESEDILADVSEIQKNNNPATERIG